MTLQRYEIMRGRKHTVVVKDDTNNGRGQWYGGRSVDEGDSDSVDEGPSDVWMKEIVMV